MEMEGKSITERIAASLPHALSSECVWISFGEQWSSAFTGWLGIYAGVDICVAIGLQQLKDDTTHNVYQVLWTMPLVLQR